MTERTLSILKPDAISKNVTGKINAIFEENNLSIVAMKMVQLTEDQAKEFYIEHAEKPFYNTLVGVMTAGPVVLQVLEGENAIDKNRDLMGFKDPALAEEGTIRKMFGQSIDVNTVHGSVSVEDATREITLFFKEDEICAR
ncbi:MAG: nucleoside-diphosphate kinase [Proteobacteria bacterium]|nr:nucleoside-diphosphate kinase [Pseudomonadota bacterium]